MREIIVMTEEPSAGIIVEHVVAKQQLRERVRVLPHQGRSDLERSIPRKIGRWRSSVPPRFIILRDNDGGDCQKLKARLAGFVPSDASDRVKIRIVIHELENWYYGDLAAVLAAGLLTDSAFSKLSRNRRYRDPDTVGNAKDQFRKLVDQHGQMALANTIGPHLEPERNTARSFRAFVDALTWAAA